MPTNLSESKIIFRILLAIFSAICISINSSNAQIPVDSSYSAANVLKQISKNYPYAVIAKDSLPASVQEYRNLVYADLGQTKFGKRELHLDIFRPKNRKILPAVVMVHGGGWRSGTKAMQVPLAQELAAMGFVTIPVEYQLSLEEKYPASVHNLKAAIRWIKANAAEYRIDTSQIAISGCSAGGHLAALIGFTNHIPLMEGNQGMTGISSAVKAIIDIDGVVDFLAPNVLNLKRQPNSADAFWLGGLFEEKPATWKEASPIFWATEKTAVPILFINGGYSRFHAGRDELIGMLNEWKIYSDIHTFEVQIHPFWLFHPWMKPTANKMAAFLNKVLPAK